MKALKEYVIPFVGLKEGVHDYSYDIDEKFFDSFDYSEIEQGKVHAEVSMERKERMLVFEFAINGHVIIPCDRCLEDMEYPVNKNERLIVKFGHDYMEESEEIYVIPETDSHIDISTFIYEYIMLSFPLKRVHPDSDKDCNQSVIEKLDQHASPVEDPRWEALKGLKNKKD
jgi:uncharacterized metal-binding protein YceD (DUF177 family)